MADLPTDWTYGVSADGRVFFISDGDRTTSWIHPRTGRPVNSGHMTRSDLPRGWEEGFTPEGASYFIDHNERRTTFTHPQTGLTSEENSAFVLQELAPQTRIMSSVGSKTARDGCKVHSFGKRQLSVKRNVNFSVERRGWIYKQDSSGMRLWKRKWFVLSDHCLFYYKDSREQSVLGSIPLLSYEVSPVSSQDHISRKFAFKAQHSGMRTYFFSAETQDDMNAWITAMNQASKVQDRASRIQDRTKTSTSRVQTRDHNLPNIQVYPQLRNGVGKVHNGVHCGTNTKDRPSDLLLESSRSSEQTLVHEVQLEPIHRVQSPELVTVATTGLSTPPQDSLSRCNGLDLSPSPILEPNGIAAGTYQTSPPASTPPGSVCRQVTPTGRQATPTPRQATPPISSVRDQVQNWVRVQKEEQRRSLSRSSLHRVTPPTQFSPIEPHHHTAPAGRLGEYRYAQHRLSHFGLSDSAPSSFWRLYEWQQRHQYRHGNPTAPLYSPAPLRPFGPRPVAAADQPRTPTPRCIEVPPSTTEVPPSLPLAPITRRPHTPAERLTVRPTNESTEPGGAFTTSPRRSQSQFFKASTLDRRSLPVSGHMSHTFSAPSLHGKTVDDSYLQLKKDLEFLDLKPGGTTKLRDSSCNVGRPVKAAESDIDVKLSRLCEQDKSLKELESRIRAVTEDKEQVEGVLALCHQQMEQLSDSGALQKVSSQQKLLQEDLVHLRAQQSRAFTDMCHSWEDYLLLEKSVEQLRSALKQQLELSTTQLLRSDLKRELWRIEDVLSGLSSSRTQFSLTVQALSRPERTLVPSVQESEPSTSPASLWSEDPPPPRPPLPCGFDDDEDSAPEVPPLPREAAVIRHTSVRGLKRQSDERRRDREGGDWKFQADLRSFLSEPELPVSSAPHLDPPPTGLSGSSSGPLGSSSGPAGFASGPVGSSCGPVGSSSCPVGFSSGPVGSSSGLVGSSSNLKQSSVSAFVTLRRGAADRERPRSAFEYSASSSMADSDWPVPSRGRMSADEQLRRLNRWSAGQSDHSSDQVCAHGAPPPLRRAPPPTPKRSSSRERRQHILATRPRP